MNVNFSKHNYQCFQVTYCCQFFFWKQDEIYCSSLRGNQAETLHYTLAKVNLPYSCYMYTRTYALPEKSPVSFLCCYNFSEHENFRCDLGRKYLMIELLHNKRPQRYLKCLSLPQSSNKTVCLWYPLQNISENLRLILQKRFTRKSRISEN